MAETLKSSSYQNLLQRVSILLEEARRKTIRQVNTVIVETYWEIGKLIIEEEQKGKERAEYGEELLIKLSNDLTQKYGKGFSVDNLEAMRKFYIVYPHLLKSETLSRKSIKSATSSRISSALLIEKLTWSHFRELIKTKDNLKRAFYEIETLKNTWSVRELKREIGIKH